MFGKEMLIVTCCKTQLRPVQQPLVLAAVSGGICWNRRRKLIKVGSNKETPGSWPVEGSSAWGSVAMGCHSHRKGKEFSSD